MKRGARHTAATADVERAVEALLRRHAGPQRAATWDQLAAESGIAQRRLRAVATRLDGVRFLIGVVMPDDVGADAPRGVFLAESPEQAAWLTALIVSKATDELARSRRRQDYADAMNLGLVEQLSMGLVA